MPLRVAIADDHPIALSGLERLLASDPGLELVGKAMDAVGLDGLLNEQRPDVCVCDLMLGRHEAGESLPRWTREFSATRFIVLSMISDLAVVRTILEKGASGYVSKSDDPSEIALAIRNASPDEKYLGRSLRAAGDVEGEIANVSGLSERQRQVFRLVGEGLSNKEISRKLFLSIKTVETHKEHIKNRLGLQQMPDLIAEAKRWCLWNGLRVS